MVKNKRGIEEKGWKRGCETYGEEEREERRIGIDEMERGRGKKKQKRKRC
jgi:hypothetical protein